MFDKKKCVETNTYKGIIVPVDTIIIGIVEKFAPLWNK